MGDPRKKRKKYTTPSHPWQKERIDTEKTFVRDYGLKNKKEIWKMESFLKSLFAQIKRVIREQTKQSEIERQQLLIKVNSLGLLEQGGKIEDILSITTKEILGRRLQTLVFKKNLARSMKQARQFITHKHIYIGEQPMTIPSYLVTVEEEAAIKFRPASKLSSLDHPERAQPEVEVKKETKPKKESTDKNEDAPVKEEKVAKEDKKDEAPKDDKKKDKVKEDGK